MRRARFPADWEAFCDRHAERTDPAYAGDLPVGFFGGPRELLGFERLVTIFYDDPALLERDPGHAVRALGPGL